LALPSRSSLALSCKLKFTLDKDRAKQPLIQSADEETAEWLCGKIEPDAALGGERLYAIDSQVDTVKDKAWRKSKRTRKYSQRYSAFAHCPDGR
jgi:hypothetical protein